MLKYRDFDTGREKELGEEKRDREEVAIWRQRKLVGRTN